MIAYVVAKKGNMEGIASNVTLDEITIGVWRRLRSNRLPANAESGLVGEDVARLIMEILGAVAAVYLIITFDSDNGVRFAFCFRRVWLIAGLLLGSPSLTRLPTR
jgi:hypothetical protein